MPHIIIEYSAGLDSALPELLQGLHESLTANGIDKARIKTRGIKIDHAIVGEGGKTMLHGTLLLLEGRDVPTKKKYGDALYGILKNAAPGDCAVTFEIRDMTKDTYYM